MRCPKCKKGLQVLRSYSVDEVGMTQDRICVSCGFRTTTVTMALRANVTAYSAQRLLREQLVRLDESGHAKDVDKKG